MNTNNGNNSNISNQNNSNINSINNNNNSSISEQLWGVRSSSRVGNTTLPSSVATSSNSNSANRNSASFGNANISNNNNINNNNSGNSLLNQQQFFRTNSWNPQQQQQQSANNNSNNSNNGSNSNSINNNLLNGPVNGGNFILIRGVTPQIDQSTLRALCAQHANGPLTYYRYITQMTCVIVRYNSKEESNNALSKLNGISLGNTTIFTQSLSENELKFLFTL